METNNSINKIKFILRLNHFIDIEYDSENEETDKIWALPIEEQVAKGDAIANLHAKFNGSNATSVSFTTEQNISKFREGSPVMVSGHNISFKGEIAEETGNIIRVTMNSFDGYPNIPAHLLISKGWTIKKAKTDIRHILQGPIAGLHENQDRYNLISGILSGGIRPEIDPQLRTRAEQIAPNTLDPSQRGAFIEAFATRNYYLIQGPPGTGKTWVLAHLAAAFANEGKNVMVTAFTHMGINNALKKIKQVTGYSKTAKIGKAHQAEYLNDEEVTVSNGESLVSHGMTFQSRGVILGATAYAPNTRKLKGFPFDIIIFDEASQMTVPLAVAAMASGTKFIFIGDHKQLAPIISEKQTDKELSKSIFEHLFQFSRGSMLQTTYRMNKEINIFSSLLFYNGQLNPHDSIANQRIKFNRPPEKHQDILEPDHPDVFVELHHKGMTTHCQTEANLVAELVNEALICGIRPKEIAVVTPYRAQVRLIRATLENLVNDPKIIKKIFIDTVERIQGQERDLVIYSLTSSDKKLILEKANFFLQPQRLNVALTRAKKKRIVIGSNVLYELHSPDPEVSRWIEILRKYLSSTTRISLTIDMNDTNDLF